MKNQTSNRTDLIVAFLIFLICIILAIIYQAPAAEPAAAGLN